MNKQRINLCAGFFLIIVLTLLSFNADSYGQDSTKSLAIKNNSLPKRIRPMLIYSPNSFQLTDSYLLVKNANGGNILAQHELGIRYLLGKGFIADTVKGAYWIKRAADRGLYNAKFNLGILQNNGWGVDWNPFEAYKNFLYAAERHMPEAELVVGVIYTENLLVQRDFGTAYKWVKVAADSGYAPAKEILDEFVKRKLIPDSLKDKKTQVNEDKTDADSDEGSQPFLFIEFAKDTNSALYKEEKLKETLAEKREDVVKAVAYAERSEEDSTAASEEIIRRASRAGSPEALMLQGRMNEIGVEDSPDPIKAAANYVQAIRLESPKAPELLWKIMQSQGFSKELKKRVDAGDAEAQFVWGCSVILGMDHQLDQQQALDLIQKSAAQKYSPALFELGFMYFSGNVVKPDIEKALDNWQKAADLGNVEAKLRIAFYNLLQHPEKVDVHSLMPFVLDAMDKGSISAAAILGYCYERGIGIKQSYAMADKLYRSAAHRGNSAAYKSLLRLYDSFRPADKAFQIAEE